MPNPCCGVIPLQRGAVLMGLLSVMRAVTCLLCTSTFLGIYINSKESIFNLLKEINITIHFLDLPSATVIGLTSFMISVFIFEIPLYGSVAFLAAKKNQARCNQWWKTKCVLLGISLAVGIVAMVYSEDRVIVAVFLLLVTIYDFYLIWVIKAYAQE